MNDSAYVPPLVIGVDPSLTSTGISSSDGWVRRVTSKPGGHTLAADLARLESLTHRVLDVVTEGDTRYPDLIVLEGPAYYSKNAGAHQIAGLWWLLARRLDRVAPLAIAPPACRVKYATGVGNRGKDEVLLAASRRYSNWPIDGNDTADATVLMAMGRDFLGHPIGQTPAGNQTALAKVAWPHQLVGG